jgi:exopolysaccharide biosynthesis WecB/TagA/CpsF family protein
MTGNSLGSILLKKRLITQSQLEQALRKQRQQAKACGWQLLGEILVDDRVISRRALENALATQAQLNEVHSLQADFEPSQIDILNVSIDNMSMHELLDQLHNGVVLTPNVDHVMKLQKDPDFLRAYALADYRVCDSQVLMYASKFLGTPFKEKVSGSDLFPRFCEFHQYNDGITVFLLGGAKGVAAQAKNNINERLDREIVIGAHSPSFGFEKDEQECLEIVEMINQSKATVLAVGVGAPKQEKWIYKYKHKLPHVKIFMAVGATLDFEAGVLKRSPKWMSDLGIEWLFRIYCDPQRLWKRYLVEDLPFFWLLLQQKFGLYTPPRFETLDRRHVPVNVKVTVNRLLRKRATTKV